MGWYIFEKEGTSQKRIVEIEDWGFCIHYLLEISRKFNLWWKVYTKTDSWFQKFHEEFEQLERGSGKFKKLQSDGLRLSKKYIPSAKTYIEDLSNITFNYLRENSPNDVCHFRNHKSFFMTQLVCIFVTQTLHNFYKKKTHQGAYFETFHCFLKGQFLLKVLIFFQCHDRYFFCTFLAETLYAIGKSSTASKFKFSDLSLLS